MKHPELKAIGRRVTVQLLGETIVKEFSAKQGRELDKFLAECRDNHFAGKQQDVKLKNARNALYKAKALYERTRDGKQEYNNKKKMWNAESKFWSLGYSFPQPLSVLIENIYQQSM